MKIVRRLFFIMLLSVGGLSCFSQDLNPSLPDSLQMLLHENNKADARRLEALRTVIDALHEQQQYEASGFYINELDELSNTLKNNYFQALSKYYRGSFLISEGKFDEAEATLQSSLQMAKVLPDNIQSKTLKIRIQLAFSAIYLRQTMLPQAYQSLLEGMEINKELGNSNLQYKLENNLLVVYRYLNMEKEIIAISKKILANPEYAAYNKYYICYNLVACYTDLARLDSAALYLDTATMYAQTPREHALIPYYQGSIDLEQRNYEAALTHFDECLTEITDENISDVKSNTLIFKGRAYSMLGNCDNALDCIDEGIRIAERNGLLYIVERGLAIKQTILYKMRNYETFAQVAMRHNKIADSLKTVENVERLRQLDLEHQFDIAKEQMAQAQRLKDMEQQRQRFVLYLIIVLLLFIVLTVALLLRQNKIQLKNKQLEEEAMARELDLRNRELTAKSLVESQGKMHKDFDYYFTQTHPDFYKNLSRDFPDLTPYETHLCAYIKLNLNTKDIAEICGIAPASVKMARHRLRKSLGITNSDTDLTKFLSKY